MVTLISCQNMKFICDAWTLVMLGLWTLHVLVNYVLELIFCIMGHLSTLVSHFNILESSLAI